MIRSMRSGSKLYTYTELSQSVAEGIFVLSGSAALTSSTRIPPVSTIRNMIYLKSSSFSGNHHIPWYQTNPSYDSDTFGVWGYGKLNTNDLNDYSGIPIVGYHINLQWNDLRTSSAGYDWSFLDNRVDTLDSNNLLISVQLQVGENTPSFIMTESGYFFTTGGVSDGPWPQYFTSTYKNYYLGLLSDIADHINSYPNRIKKRFKYLHVSEGSTGDEFAYKGDPVNSADTITVSDWTFFKRGVWASASLYNQQNSSFLKMLYNFGNDALNFDVMVYDLPNGSWTKYGNLSHDLVFDGEASYVNRVVQFQTCSFYMHRARAEGQNFWEDTSFTGKNIIQTWCMCVQSAAGGLDVLNVPTGWLNQGTSDIRPLQFFNKYAGQRNAKHAKRGFIVFRDMIDLLDTVRFPTASYGAIVTGTTNINNYNQRVNNINNTTEASQFYKDYNIVLAQVDYFSNTRLANITSSFIGTASYNPNSRYNHDYGYGMVKNWQKYVTQLNPDMTSYGKHRIHTSDSQMYGWQCRTFMGTSSIYCTIDPDIENLSGSTNILLTVTYWDSGSGSWSISTVGASQTVQNGTTNTWKTASLNVPDFTFGGQHTSGSDFTLNYVTGSTTIFQMVEFDNLSRQ